MNFIIKRPCEVGMGATFERAPRDMPLKRRRVSPSPAPGEAPDAAPTPTQPGARATKLRKASPVDAVEAGSETEESKEESKTESKEESKTESKAAPAARQDSADPGARHGADSRGQNSQDSEESGDEAGAAVPAAMAAPAATVVFDSDEEADQPASDESDDTDSGESGESDYSPSGSSGRSSSESDESTSESEGEQGARGAQPGGSGDHKGGAAPPQDGRTLRPRREKAGDGGGLVLEDLGSEHLLLDAPRPIPLTGQGGAVAGHRLACVKGTLFLEGDRVRCDGALLEIIGFGADAVTLYGHWLVPGAELRPGRRVGHANLVRVLPSVTVALCSHTALEHLGQDGYENVNNAATAKITHQADLVIHAHAARYPDAVAALNGAVRAPPSPRADIKHGAPEEDKRSAGGGGGVPALVRVERDRGLPRPRLANAQVVGRWGETAQRALLVFVRRVWPGCDRDPERTVPMAPPRQVDALGARGATLEDDDNESQAILRLTRFYSDSWDLIRRDARLKSCERWLASALDALRRRYLQVQRAPWELAFRQIRATLDLVARSVLAPASAQSQ
jgi:hypothetical protein